MAVVLDLPNAALFNTAPHAVATPNHKVFSLRLHNCSFATVMNRSENS